MKTTLWLLGGALVVDMLFLSYFYVLRAEYYFPDRYEDALVPTFWALFLGLPVLGSFVSVLILYLQDRRRRRSS